MDQILFFVFAAVAAASALVAVTRKNAVASACWLVVMFFGLAAVYVLLEAYFVAAVQILVYAGAIMVLFLFVIMLLDLRSTELAAHSGPKLRLLGIGLAALLLVGLLHVLRDAAGSGRSPTASPPRSASRPLRPRRPSLPPPPPPGDASRPEAPAAAPAAPPPVAVEPTEPRGGRSPPDRDGADPRRRRRRPRVRREPRPRRRLARAAPRAPGAARRDARRLHRREGPVRARLGRRGDPRRRPPWPCPARPRARRSS